MTLTLHDVTDALSIMKKLNDELEEQDYVEEQFHATTDGKYLWIDFAEDRVFDSHEVEDSYDILLMLESDLRCAGNEAVAYKLSSLKHVKLLKE